MIVLLDNYDSFTFNVADLFAQIGAEVQVHRNDQLTVEEIEKRRPTHLVISPGPGRPEQAGITLEAIQYFAGRLPLLGVCLGHQAIAQAFGARVIRNLPVHGKTSKILHDSRGVYRDLPSPLIATRYHSLVVEEASLPDEILVSARTETGEVMGLRHKKLAMEGVQFHPESILTEFGARMFQNFLEMSV